MSTRKKIMCAILILGVALPAAYFAAVLLSMGSLATIHQRTVTRSLAEWGKSYSVIHDDDDAWRAIGMLEYIQRYYVVGPGYRSDPETERALEEQREKSLQTICNALDAYSDSKADGAADKIRAAKLKALAGSRWESK
jgi:hypothetical protein